VELSDALAVAAAAAADLVRFINKDIMVKLFSISISTTYKRANLARK
jgi:hypothetical protein